MTIAAPSAGARRAALLLHSMQPADRQWLLAALPVGQGQSLAGLLDELRELGFTADPDLLQPILHAPTAPSAPLAELHADQVRWLAERLRCEPPALAASLLTQRAWSWCDTLRAHWDVAFRQRVDAALSNPRRPALERAVCNLLSHELPVQAVSVPRASRFPVWERLLSRRDSS